MRCRRCNYALWNIEARACPECGEPWRPGDFDFAPGTVHFLCPRCRRAYPGRDERGHPAPSRFACTQCGAAIELDQMILAPAPGLREQDTRPGPMPWRHREGGVIAAFIRTVGLAMVAPHRLIRGVPPSAPAGEALAFGLVTLLVAHVTGGALPLLAYQAWSWFSWGIYDWIWEVGWNATYLVLMPFGVAGLIPLWALSAHLFLRLTGGARHPLDRTFHAFGYGAAAAWMAALPCLGTAAGAAWGIASATVMLAVGQRVHPVRAILAVWVLPLCAALLFGGTALMAWWASSASRGPGFAATPGTMAIETVGSSLTDWSLPGGPGHAAELMLSGDLDAYWPAAATWSSPFCQPGTKTTPASIPLGGTTIERVLAMSRREQMALIESVREAAPGNLVAHRLGDFVFTYHGAMIDSDDVEVWLVVMLPDPDANGPPAPDDPVQIFAADYGVREIAYAELAAELKDQNDYRGDLGLPPLPDPATVTHAKPAVAAPPSGAGGND